VFYNKYLQIYPSIINTSDNVLSLFNVKYVHSNGTLLFKITRATQQVSTLCH
jgi:hypothetical protein